MTDGSVSLVRLSVSERARVDRGIFVRIDLPRALPIPQGGVATTALIGRVNGVLRVYANVCRHNAIPLDARGGTALGVMTDDGTALLCDSHGASYRPDDGMCTSGPCVGVPLYAFDVEERDDLLSLVFLPGEPKPDNGG